MPTVDAAGRLGDRHAHDPHLLAAAAASADVWTQPDQRLAAPAPRPARHVAKHVDTDGGRTERQARDWRWWARESVRAVSQSMRTDADGVTWRGRVPTCGLYRHAGAEVVEVRRSTETGTASYAGLQTCGSVWACPVCSAKIRRERQAELDLALERHRAGEYFTTDRDPATGKKLTGGHATRLRWVNGRPRPRAGGVEFVTLTLRHKRSDSLASLIDACADGWREIQRSYWYKHLRRRLPFAFVRALEVTFSWNNGWHAHLHVLLLTDDPWTGVTRRNARANLSREWLIWAQTQLGRAPNDRHGVVWESGSAAGKLGSYLAKLQEHSDLTGLAAELTRGDMKRGRAGSLMPFELAVLGHEHGDQRAASKWVEYEAATKARQALTWSTGLKRRLVPDWPAISDEQIAQAADDGEVVAEIGDLDLSALRASGMMFAVLLAAERGNPVSDILERSKREALRLGWSPPGRAGP